MRRLILTAGLLMLMPATVLAQQNSGTVFHHGSGGLSIYDGTAEQGTIYNPRDGSLSIYSGDARGGTVFNPRTGGLSIYDLNPNGSGTVFDLETRELSTIQVD